MVYEPDIVEIARQTVELLKPALLFAAGGVATGAAREAGKALLDWLKTKLTRSAAAAVLDEAISDPSNQTNWEALALQICKLLEQDQTFRRELLERLPREAFATRQTASITGDNDDIVQIAGDDNRVNINRGDR